MNHSEAVDPEGRLYLSDASNKYCNADPVHSVPFLSDLTEKKYLGPEGLNGFAKEVDLSDPQQEKLRIGYWSKEYNGTSPKNEGQIAQVRLLGRGRSPARRWEELVLGFKVR